MPTPCSFFLHTNIDLPRGKFNAKVKKVRSRMEQSLYRNYALISFLLEALFTRDLFLMFLSKIAGLRENTADILLKQLEHFGFMLDYV
ncbi:hypothetical protein V2J09_013002 [Rumex salicifolius]